MNTTTTNTNPDQSRPRSSGYHLTVAGLVWLAAATLTYLVSLWLLKHDDW